MFSLTLYISFAESNSVPLVSMNLMKGNLFDVYSFVSRVPTEPTVVLATSSLNKAFIKVLLPTPEFPII